MFFFFQAEDGIRDRDVTGVQTCAFRSTSRNPVAYWRFNDKHDPFQQTRTLDASHLRLALLRTNISVSTNVTICGVL